MLDLKLRRNKDGIIYLRHPWIFSGAIDSRQDFPEEGDEVRVVSSKGKFVGIGHYYTGSIAVRIISDQDKELDQKFWNHKIDDAINYRIQLKLYDPADNNAMRIINGEGDGLSGLIVDYYKGLAVVQCHGYGMVKASEKIKQALLNQKLLPIHSIYLQDKSDNRGRKEDGLIHGDKDREVISENGIQFIADAQKGQKTGFFLDQKNNRQLLGSISESKTVLNTFCYNGGFSLYALQAGANHVTSIDSSSVAMEQLEENIILNSMQEYPHQSITDDVMDYLRNTEETFDIIVLDPPAFAKSRRKSHNAVQAYKRLNILGMNRLKPKGLLMTFSCSQVIDEQLFYHTIVSSGLELGQNFRVIQKLSQGPDHPVNLFHSEGRYLKGLLLQKV